MTIPRLSGAQVEYIITLVIDFIQERRRAFSPAGAPLTNDQRARFAPYFPEDVLNTTRFLRVDELANPRFYPELAGLGFNNLPQFSTMAATTFVDVIAAQVEFTDSLRFHELVHAVQYRQLGLGRFAERYVLGFLNGGDYEHIPLEQNAYELEARFARDKSRKLDVLAEVNCWINEGRF